MRVVHTIHTPWAPYAVAFSRDGMCLAIGGGSWYGGGGIVVVDCPTLEPAGDAVLDLDQPTVSSLCFAADDRHVVATTWQASQRPGPLLVHEARGARLVVTDRLASPPDGAPSGLALLPDHRALVRRHRVAAADTLALRELPHGVACDGVAARIALLGDRAVTGDHGVRGKSPDTGALVIAPLDRPHAAELVPVHECRRITAVASAGDTLWTGGGDGELDAWTLSAGELAQHRLRGRTQRGRPRARGHLTWATYTPSSIVGISALRGHGAFSVDAGGELTALDSLATWPLEIDGTPRALAAHPDRPWLAVGIKQGGFADPQSVVAIVEVAPTTLDPAWRTPAVREMARAVDQHRTDDGRFDAYALVVFADALEQAGADARVLAHLHDHDPRLRSCWVVDAALGY